MDATNRMITDDWERVKRRFEHWWACDLFDRALVQVTAPRTGVARAEWPGGEVTPETRWTDVDYMIWRARENRRTTYYGGEALPVLYHSWSVGHALLMGCQPIFTENTVWVDPIAPDGEYPTIRFQRDSRWWRWMYESTRTAARASQGQYFVMPMWGNHAGDNLALVRGVGRLLEDIADNPEWVRQAVQETSDVLLEMFAELWPLVGQNVTGLAGSINYVSLWSPEKTLGFDCDVSCMVSPRAFESIFLPPLVETMRTVDHVVYHLDGPGAIPHLDVLLSLPEIQAIQWVPGAGHAEMAQWVPLIRRIQRAGKSVLVAATPEEVELLLREVSPRGLCIRTSCETEEAARDLVALVERSARDA